MRIVLPIILLISSGIASAAAPPEVRATWLTTTANEALLTPAHTADAMKRLRQVGLNTVYVECWKNGYTEYPSTALLKAIKISHKINLENQPKTRDLLAETTIEAHRNSLLCIAWFEYGFMAGSKDTKNELVATKPKWLLRNHEGSEVAPDGTVWLNPVHPEVRNFLLDLVLECALNYDIDGVQFDDRLAWPDWSMGYDDATKAAYAKDHVGSPPPEDFNDPDWVRWRQTKVTEFAGELNARLRKIRKNLLISVSPSPYPWSAEHHAVDWPTWVKNGWMDEFVPQLYRDSFARFQSEWPRQVEAAADRRGDLVAGLRILGEGADTPWDDLRRMVDLTRASGAGGHSWWFSRGVLETYLEQIAAYYDVPNQGFAPHPKRDLNWRPPPIIGERHGMHWTLRVETPADYQLIVQKAGIWTILKSEHAIRGTIDLSDKKYDAIELIVDHRER